MARVVQVLQQHITAAAAAVPTSPAEAAFQQQVVPQLQEALVQLQQPPGQLLAGQGEEVRLVVRRQCGSSYSTMITSNGLPVHSCTSAVRLELLSPHCQEHLATKHNSPNLGTDILFGLQSCRVWRLVSWGRWCGRPSRPSSSSWRST
jgi:hypothetical protein